MRTSLVVTFTGEDRSGLVDRLAAVVRRHGGNWQRSHMARLAGRFAGILEVTVADDQAEALSDALREAGRAAALSVAIDRGAQVARPPDRTFALELTGHDREGIVAELARALAERHLNIEALETDTAEAPMAGGVVFTARAELRAPGPLSLDDLHATLDELSEQLNVEISLEERG